MVWWATFEMGYAVSTSSNIAVKSVVGQVFVGTMLQANTRIESGLLANTELITSISEKQDVLPLPFSLRQNYPNPFNPETTIEFTLPRPEKVRVIIYDMRGNLVRTLLDGAQKSPGQYRLNWNGLDDRGKPVSSGVYFYRIQTNSFTQTKKMT
jgi:hypothetical protein